MLNMAQARPEIRVVLVSAAGDNYSAGNDLQDFWTILPETAIARRSK
jgi:enoyl-CoA hydratase/carnithine racemase